MKKTLQECKEIVANNGGFIYDDIESAYLKEQLTDLANKMFYEQSEWISVEDALPKNKENVLCYNGYRMIENSYSMFTDQDQNWFKNRFTHWMPLPSPPKQ
jgi:hypothetical protein